MILVSVLSYIGCTYFPWFLWKLSQWPAFTHKPDLQKFRMTHVCWAFHFIFHFTISLYFKRFWRFFKWKYCFVWPCCGGEENCQIIAWLLQILQDTATRQNAFVVRIIKQLGLFLFFFYLLVKFFLFGRRVPHIKL